MWTKSAPDTTLLVYSTARQQRLQITIQTHGLTDTLSVLKHSFTYNRKFFLGKNPGLQKFIFEGHVLVSSVTLMYDSHSPPRSTSLYSLRYKSLVRSRPRLLRLVNLIRLPILEKFSVDPFFSLCVFQVQNFKSQRPGWDGEDAEIQCTVTNREMQKGVTLSLLTMRLRELWLWLCSNLHITVRVTYGLVVLIQLHAAYLSSIT